MRRKWILLAPLVIGGFGLFIAIGGAVVQLLWNWLLPPLFGWPQVTFWQALGLLALCRILFGGSGGRAMGHARWKAEDKARFRMRMRERLGMDPSAGESPGQ